MSLETLVKVGRLGKSYLLFKILGKLICYKFRVVRHLKRSQIFLLSYGHGFLTSQVATKLAFQRTEIATYNFILLQSLNFTNYMSHENFML